MIKVLLHYLKFLQGYKFYVFNCLILFAQPQFVYKTYFLIALTNYRAPFLYMSKEIFFYYEYTDTIRKIKRNRWGIYINLQHKWDIAACSFFLFQISKEYFLFLLNVCHWNFYRHFIKEIHVKLFRIQNKVFFCVLNHR